MHVELCRIIPRKRIIKAAEIKNIILMLLSLKFPCIIHMCMGMEIIYMLIDTTFIYHSKLHTSFEFSADEE